MDSLQKDLDQLEEAMRQMFQYLKKPSTWVNLTNQAGVQIDRPSAGILHTLIACKSSCKLLDLADMLGIEAPSVTRKSQELEKLGLIRRSRSLTDKRSVDLEITDKGRDIENRIIKARRDISLQVFGQWSQVERQQFVSLFEKYCRGLVNYSDDTNKLTTEVN
jgi:DNA-binding MarR family transcriptional regulator